MSHTPGPWPTLELIHYEQDEYPEPHSSHARLRGSDMLCYGILFGEIPQAQAMQKHIVHCVNSHDALVEALRWAGEELAKIGKAQTVDCEAAIEQALALAEGK